MEMKLKVIETEIKLREFPCKTIGVQIGSQHKFKLKYVSNIDHNNQRKSLEIKLHVSISIKYCPIALKVYWVPDHW